MKSIIALTMGDPAGVGPEIIYKSLQHNTIRKKMQFVVYGNYPILEKVNKILFKRIKNKFEFDIYSNLTSETLKKYRFKSSRIPLIQISEGSRESHRFGETNKNYGQLAAKCIEGAVGVAKKGLVDAIVTCPINKISFWKSGVGKKYIGHTEYLAHLTQSPQTSLMMVHRSLRSVHVTSHISISRVARSIKKTKIFKTILLAEKGCCQLGIYRPRIAVSALNPHGGEDGLLGREEEKEIYPAIEQARKLGHDVHGPIPGDVIWPKVQAGEFDVGVAMYHDQGQIPIKINSIRRLNKQLWITEGVNVTLGLPIIRTSVAHGTAYDIAGQGVASEKSLLDAIHLADQMVRIKHKNESK